LTELVRATGISKRYGIVQALRDVDFDVRRGEIVALAGENGSGKSTLAKILSGVVPHDAGSILVEGEEVAFARPRDALESQIAPPSPV
jgi:ABC-type sugar transport system ATPase subunit